MQDAIPKVHYLLGKALTFCAESDDVSSFSTADVEFEHGSSLACPYSALELWKMKHRQEVRQFVFAFLTLHHIYSQIIPMQDTLG